MKNFRIWLNNPASFKIGILIGMIDLYRLHFCIQLDLLFFSFKISIPGEWK